MLLDGWGKPRGRRGGLISSDLQTLRSLVTFSQAETQEEAGYTPCLFFFCLFFFTPAFSLRFFLHVHTLKASQRSPFSLSHTWRHTHKTYAHTHTHTPNACVHTPKLSLATELPLQWDHRFKNKAVGLKSSILTSRNISQMPLYFPSQSNKLSARYLKCRQVEHKLNTYLAFENICTTFTCFFAT